jgi:hypothetical protein
METLELNQAGIPGVTNIAEGTPLDITLFL